MNRVDEILSKISDFKGMIKDTSRQLFELENRIIFGALTPEEARSYKERWEDYLQYADKMIRSLVEELYILAGQKTGE